MKEFLKGCKNMKHNEYTAGDLAKLTGVSYKTIRHYCDLGLLVPDHYEVNGYKIFGENAVATLQRILVLRYLKFSLQEIKEMITKESNQVFFEQQEKLLKAQLAHMEQVLKAVQEMKKLGEEERITQMVHIIHMTQQSEEIIKQYMESGNLKHRINIHAYSTSKVKWYDWVLQGLELNEGMKILEIGCGNAMLWKTIYQKLPDHLRILLTDRSTEMLEAAKNQLKDCESYLKEHDITIEYAIRDAENLQVDEKGFDRIIANHMLYHVSDEKRPQLIQTCAGLLKEEGMFYASTVGRTHMKQLFDLTAQLDKRIHMPSWMTKGFELENGAKQLEKAFHTVRIEEQENDLLVPDPQVVYEYIVSLPGNAKEILTERKEESMEYLRKKISPEHPYFIHKSTGAFRAYKK